MARLARAPVARRRARRRDLVVVGDVGQAREVLEEEEARMLREMILQVIIDLFSTPSLFYIYKKRSIRDVVRFSADYSKNLRDTLDSFNNETS